MHQPRKTMLGGVVAWLAAVTLALPPVRAQSPPLRPATQAESGLDLSTFDPGARPQDDLFQFVNGGWLARTDVPADRVSITSFTDLVDRADLDVRAVVEALAASGKARPGSIAQQVVDLYASMMNEARIEELGATPMSPELQRIDAIQSARDVAAEAGRLSSIGMGGPFPGTVGTDARDGTVTVVQISQAGLLLPDRDHYLSPEPRLAAIRAQYEQYLVTIFTLAARAAPVSDARAVIALESAIARAEPIDADTGASGSTPLRFDLAQLDAQMPGFDWRAWAHPQGLDRPAAIVLMQPSFFKAFAALVPATSLSAWRAWLAARYITASAPYVDHRFSDARFEFFGRILTGQEAPRARWKRGVGIVNSALGQAVGRLYVERHFPAASKSRVQKMVSRLLDEYRRALDGFEWMHPSTRSEARRKLARLTARIGYPDTWRDYQGLVIKPDDLVGNLQRAQQFDNTWRMSHLAAADGAEWPMTPQTVNAFYNPAHNEIVFPAALLQPPLFNPTADDAVNYGAIGAVIGHEIGHAFDGQGRGFDGSGAARRWWTPADEAAYRERSRRLEAELAALTPIDGVHLNGSLLLPESLGDLAGLTIAYRAYQRARDGAPAPVLDGFTGDQRFFLGWAQLWRSKVRPEYLRQQAAISNYPPADVRANLPLGQTPGFYDAFHVQPGDRLYRDPAARVHVW